MYPLTDSVKALFESENPQLVYIEINTSNETIEITNKDIVMNGLEIDRYCTSGSKIEIGSAIASELKLKLNNYDGNFNNIAFEGAELFVQIGIQDTTIPNSDTYFVPMGYFTVDESPRMLSTISLVALDRMVRFDKLWDSSISFPATLGQLIEDACDNCNVPLGVTLSSLTNYNYIVSQRPEDENLTYRQIVQWCAELMGVCAWIDWDGQLQMNWYEDANYTTSVSNRFSGDIYEDQITITGVAATIEETIYLAGSDEYAINIEGNSLLQENVQNVIGNLNQFLNGFSYVPCNAKIISAPYLYPLDKIIYIDAEENQHNSIITNITYKINQNTSISGKGETSTNNSYAKSNPLTNRQKVIIETIQNEINSALNDRVQTLIGFNDLLCNSLGLYFTEVSQPDGSIKYYMHDNPTLDESNTIYTINSGGFAYTNSGWNDGNPVWEYGFSKDGNAVFKIVSAYGVEVSDPNQDYSAQMVPTGFDIYYRAMKVLTVNDQRTEVTDLLVKDRLQIGQMQIVPNNLGADFIVLS